jgi:hypothetical protein
MDGGPKLRVKRSFRPAKAAVGYVQIKPRMSGHPPKNRRHILDWVGGDGQDAVAALRHGRTVRFGRRTRRN